jgi:hypothetical protein
MPLMGLDRHGPKRIWHIYKDYRQVPDEIRNCRQDEANGSDRLGVGASEKSSGRSLSTFGERIPLQCSARVGYAWSQNGPDLRFTEEYPNWQ